MKYKIFDSKRGIAEDETIPFIIFVFIAAFGIFLFSINERIKSNELIGDIQLQKYALNGHEVLIEYVSQIDEKGERKIDSISKYYIEKNYDSLKKDIQDFFDIKLAHLPEWYVDAIDSFGEKIFTAQGSYYLSETQNYAQYQVGSIIIPANGDDSRYIQLKLFYGRQE
ncbi:MAG: hypothetical protein AABX33_07875 [Nanoarchaeota archaeon]